MRRRDGHRSTIGACVKSICRAGVVSGRFTAFSPLTFPGKGPAFVSMSSGSGSDFPSGPAGRLVWHFKMERIPHEGAWFAPSWVAEARATDPAGRRPAGSAIMALMTRRDFSAMHRLKTDETWHFYGGGAAELLLLHPHGRTERVRFGLDVFAGERPQVTVPAGVWMGARPVAEAADAYSFFGCTLAPGFAEEDYEPGHREELQRGWPAEEELIAALTREDPLTRSTRDAAGAPRGRA